MDKKIYIHVISMNDQWRREEITMNKRDCEISVVPYEITVVQMGKRRKIYIHVIYMNDQINRKKWL